MGLLCLFIDPTKEKKQKQPISTQYKSTPADATYVPSRRSRSWMASFSRSRAEGSAASSPLWASSAASHSASTRSAKCSTSSTAPRANIPWATAGKLSCAWRLVGWLVEGVCVGRMSVCLCDDGQGIESAVIYPHTHTYPSDAAPAANASSVHLLCICFAI